MNIKYWTTASLLFLFANSGLTAIPSEDYFGTHMQQSSLEAKFGKKKEKKEKKDRTKPEKPKFDKRKDDRVKPDFKHKNPFKPKNNDFNVYRTKESKLAHTMLDGLRGIEIGAAYDNPFGLKTINIDITDDVNSPSKKQELLRFKATEKVDFIASGDDLPFKDSTVDFVINANVIQHFFDPIKAIQEWLRVVKPGGYVYMIVPNANKMKDKPSATTVAELLDRQTETAPSQEIDKTYTYWTLSSFQDLCDVMNWQVVATQEVDDKKGLGFTIVLKKPE